MTTIPQALHYCMERIEYFKVKIIFFMVSAKGMCLMTPFFVHLFWYLNISIVINHTIGEGIFVVMVFHVLLNFEISQLKLSEIIISFMGESMKMGVYFGGSYEGINLIFSCFSTLGKQK